MTLLIDEPIHFKPLRTETVKMRIRIAGKAKPPKHLMGDCEMDGPHAETEAELAWKMNGALHDEMRMLRRTLRQTQAERDEALEALGGLHSSLNNATCALSDTYDWDDLDHENAQAGLDWADSILDRHGDA